MLTLLVTSRRPHGPPTGGVALSFLGAVLKSWEPKDPAVGSLHHTTYCSLLITCITKCNTVRIFVHKPLPMTANALIQGVRRLITDLQANYHPAIRCSGARGGGGASSSHTPFKYVCMFIPRLPKTFGDSLKCDLYNSNLIDQADSLSYIVFCHLTNTTA